MQAIVTDPKSPPEYRGGLEGGFEPASDAETALTPQQPTGERPSCSTDLLPAYPWLCR